MTPARSIHVLLAWCLGLLSPLLSGDAAVARTADGGQYHNQHGIEVLSLIGDPTTLGRQAGELTAQQTQAMLTALSLHPAMAGFLRQGQPKDDAIPAEYRDEITTWAKTATCDPATLLRANLAVDALCTAVVRLPDAARERPLLIARNMDFAPAHLLGPKTVLIVRRPTGRRASLSIGWPGYAGIVSGMNDAGVSACLLLNHTAKRNPDGDSLGLRLRAILDHATTLDEAVARFAAAPTAASNYVLLADASAATVVWWSGGKLQRNDPVEGWLFCTNAHIDPDSHLPEDKRGRHAHELTRVRRNPDVDWMKRLLTATYMPGNITAMNAQAMVLVPATRTLHLALFGTKEAALSPWHQVDAAQLMAGSDLANVPMIRTPAIDDPFQHYTKAP